METYAKQSKPSARTLSARAGHGQPDMATILQAYRNRTAQLAALTDDDEQALQGKFTTQLQEDDDEALQGKFVAQLQSDDDEEPLQGKFLTQLQSTEEEEPLQQKAENRTGLPDQLKSGVENLSGYSLDAVKVHYNSPKPAQLQALAYTQGTDIHVGPGQERYLGHEAWHVVQQMQGRVQPTTQLQGVAVNDNEGLEREADVMGEKAGKYQILESNLNGKIGGISPLNYLKPLLDENKLNVIQGFFAPLYNAPAWSAAFMAAPLGAGGAAGANPPGWAGGAHPHHHQRGHLIGNQFGGAGTINNLVTLTDGTNHPGMTNEENFLAHHVAANPMHLIFYSVTANYHSGFNVNNRFGQQVIAHPAPISVYMFSRDLATNMIITDAVVNNGILQNHICD